MTWRGERLATRIPACPGRSGQAARPQGRRQDRATPARSGAAGGKRGSSGTAPSGRFAQIAKMVVAQSELPGEARQDCQRLQHGPRPHNDFSEAGGGPPGRPET